MNEKIKAFVNKCLDQIPKQWPSISQRILPIEQDIAALKDGYHNTLNSLKKVYKSERKKETDKCGAVSAVRAERSGMARPSGDVILGRSRFRREELIIHVLFKCQGRCRTLERPDARKSTKSYFPLSTIYANARFQIVTMFGNLH